MSARIYRNPQIETDEDELADAAFTYLEEQVSGWEPHGGNLDTWIVEAVAFIAAQVSQQAADVPAIIFRYYGENIVGVPYLEGASAQVVLNFTATSDPRTSDLVLTDGTEVSIGDYTAAVVGDYTLAPGASGLPSVTAEFLEPGTAPNALVADVELVNLQDWVASIEMVGVPSGGQDDETDEDYLSRLSEELTLLGPRLVRPEHVETMIRRVGAVARSLAIDTYSPSSGTYGNEKTTAWSAVDIDGEPLSTIDRAFVVALLEQYREVGWNFPYIAPQYTTVNVTWEGVTFRDFDPAIAQESGNAALAEALSPAVWGQPPFGEGQLWSRTTKVRFGELYAILNNVEGLDYVTNLTINGTTNADLSLSGVVALTRPGTISGTVTQP